MENTKWMLLQLFAEGDAAGDVAGADTGDTGADAGHQKLLELGVPADKLKKRAKKETQAAAAKPTEGRLSWDQIKADPEYNRQMQTMIKARLKDAGQAQEAMEKLSPVLQKLADRYGMDPNDLDYDALAGAVLSDSKGYRAAPDAALRHHYDTLVRQGEAMKKVFPGFDLQKELQDPAFARLTAPHVGLSVEDAYYALHRRQLQAAAMQVTARNTAQKLSNAIRAGAARPAENGTAGGGPSVTAFDYRNASRDQREALKKAIREAGARGEKLYPVR